VNKLPIKSRENIIGARAFLIGLILAVIAGIFAVDKLSPLIISALAVLGVTIGFFVAEKNVQTFLLATVSLVIVSFAGIQGLVSSATLLPINTVVGINIGKMVTSILSSLLVMFVPATIIVALKTVFSLAKS
jgi:hypothetical protein